MQRPLLASALALLTVRCGGAGDDTTGFQTPDVTTGGPSSFGDSTTGAPTTGDVTASTSTTSSTTGEPAPTSTTSPTTGEPATTTTGSTTDAPPACGDGTLDDGELCDDGNASDGDYCLSDCTAGHAILVLVGRGDDPAAIATYTPGLGWDIVDATYDLSAAELETTPDGAMAILRRAGAVPDELDELWFARWMDPDPDLLRTAEVVGDFGFTLDAPSIASVPDTVTLAFLGTDNKHYTALFHDDAWDPFLPLPAGMLDIQAFGPSGATLAPGQLETFAVYAGDDDKIYVARKPQWNAAWEPSIQAPPPAVIDTIRPAALVDPSGDLVLAYVRKSDSQIGLTRRSIADNTWTLEALIDPQALTGSAISLLRTDAGGYLLAWRGFNNDGIFVAAGAAHDEWSAPITVEVPPASTPPLLVHGALGAEAELFYTAGGALRHARIVAGEPELPQDVPGIMTAAAVAATRVQLEP